ncbi:MAG: hypothetical protein V3R25_01090 [Nitrosomonadaceae bacterium]|jgi:Ca2+-binding EF-hand superfamily protein
MCRKKTIAFIAVGSIFAVTLGNTSISSAANKLFAPQPLNMKSHMLAYADMVDPKKYGGAKTGGGGYGMELMDKNKDGKVSKEEFLKYNEAIFDKVDANRDGSVDKNEADSYVARSKPKTSPSNSISHGEMKK